VSPIDLHAHSTISDGTLTPAALVARATARGLDVLALTDHDDTAGIAEAKAEAAGTSLTLVPGVEVSASFEGETIHVVGLHVDPANAVLSAGLAAVREGRDGRARRIADGLARAGVAGAYEGARKHVTSERLMSRTHFARFLVEVKRARTMQDAFDRYLGPGKAGYVAHAWADLGDAVSWIHAAGGQAVIAHPGRYRLSAAGMRRLLARFKDAGGDGIEVQSPSHASRDSEQVQGYARAFGLLASAGSDFHDPGESPLDLGALPPMPIGVAPVWSAW
jgi:hypothetical protein